MSKIHDDLRQAELGRLGQGVASRIGGGIRIKGEVSGNEDLYVEGDVEGPIRVGDGKVTIEAKGTVNGSVTSHELVVAGTVQGNLQVRGRLEVKTRGSVVGDVATGRIIIEDGAYFKGSIEIGAKEVPNTGKTTSSSAAAASGSSR